MHKKEVFSIKLSCLNEMNFNLSLEGWRSKELIMFARKGFAIMKRKAKYHRGMKMLLRTIYLPSTSVGNNLQSKKRFRKTADNEKGNSVRINRLQENGRNVQLGSRSSKSEKNVKIDYTAIKNSKLNLLRQVYLIY